MCSVLVRQPSVATLMAGSRGRRDQEPDPRCAGVEPDARIGVRSCGALLLSLSIFTIHPRGCCRSSYADATALDALHHDNAAGHACYADDAGRARVQSALTSLITYPLAVVLRLGHVYAAWVFCEDTVALSVRRSKQTAMTNPIWTWRNCSASRCSITLRRTRKRTALRSRN